MVCEKLKSAITDAGYATVSDFAKNAGIPYTTVRRMLSSDEDFGGTSAQNLFKVCKCLNLSIDFFSDEIPKSMHLRDPKEIQIITKYRELKDMQAAVDRILEIAP